MKEKILLLIFLLGLITAGCATDDTTRDDIYPYQKKADIIIENDDYNATSDKINELAGKYEGFLKRSGLHKEGTRKEAAEFEVNVPFKFFYDYLNAFRQESKGQISEEVISDAESLVRLYRSNNEQIDKKKEELENLKYIRDEEVDVDDRVVSQYQIDRLEKEIEDLNNKRLSYIESLNYSTVNISWQNNAPKEEREQVVYQPEVEEEAVAGVQPVREIVFTEYGQIETFYVGEPVKIIFKGLDPEKTDLISKVDLDKNIVALKTVEKGKKIKIRLDKKCQIVNVGLGPIPEIETSPEINREQVVITPRVDDDCNVVGFEIRAGTIESGCAAGRKNLGKFNNCFKNSRRKYAVENKKKNSIINKKDFDWFYMLPFD